ncbi:PTH1 family peptidyl-tRNA hydrolase [Metamycoplasma subdolum]|uniref:Peptidyl-tRNA hydrolase n=1 Tax=Metamycoplasma subdolum TaxID=92407 RepID=A0A3M0A1M1_9BACT|nr:aminoacyl-tRNA hydrolase [Metamycoplasma subdolum]RMA78536.1 PTH1 family peptidyl-tRNA hydrolase [Metamycoplasma subdolum]WPB50468.1 aminoacyl-tRNA hydrolase [Metamycoplasma subdolum]
MKLIVGLGNPGSEYEDTRHNVGFMVIDAISKKLETVLNEKKFNGIYYKEKDFILAKPLTYMNLSGNFVREISDFYKIGIDDIIIIYDDMDLPVGKATIKQSGSAGGHNGMKNIIDQMKTQDIKRVKLGIGRATNAINYVLGKFTFNDKQIIDQVIEKVSDAIISFIYNDIRYVMNKFNGSF